MGSYSDPRYEAKTNFYGGLALLAVLTPVCWLCVTKLVNLAGVDSLWREACVSICVSIWMYDLFAVFHGTSALFLIAKDDDADSPGMVLCRASVCVMETLDGWTYSLILWFWFRRLQMTFGQASSDLAISPRMAGLFHGLALLCLLCSIALGIWTAAVSTDPYSRGWGIQCQPPSWQHKSALWHGWLALTLLLLVLMLLNLTLFLTRLRSVLSRAPDSSDPKQRRLRVELKKLTLVSVASTLSTLVILWWDPAYFWFVLELTLNLLLIVSVFSFGQPLFTVLFCCFTQRGWFCQPCLDLADSEQQLISEQLDKVDSLSDGAVR